MTFLAEIMAFFIVSNHFPTKMGGLSQKIITFSWKVMNYFHEIMTF